jgi:hypothetical protein
VPYSYGVSTSNVTIISRLTCIYPLDVVGAPCGYDGSLVQLQEHLLHAHYAGDELAWRRALHEGTRWVRRTPDTAFILTGTRWHADEFAPFHSLEWRTPEGVPWLRALATTSGESPVLDNGVSREKPYRRIHRDELARIQQGRHALGDALLVLLLDPLIRPHLDPMALAQAEAALKEHGGAHARLALQHYHERLCIACGERPRGERDALSPYCGHCDPDGARFYQQGKGG